MAEFVRIWNVSTQEYVEYDISPPELPDSIVVPVTPISISRDINVGVIQKIIDINDITVSAQNIDVVAEQRLITVDKSDDNSFSIEVGAANRISIIASRRENTIINSPVSQRGATGTDGVDGIDGLNALPIFESTANYPAGTIVNDRNVNWINLVNLEGSIAEPLDNPAENSLWSEVAHHEYIDGLESVTSYEISSAAEWGVVETLLNPGDLLKSKENFADTETYEVGLTVIESGLILRDTDGNSYTITEIRPTTGTAELPRTTIIVEGSLGTGTTEGLDAALKALGVTNGLDNTPNTTNPAGGGLEPGDFDSATVLFTESGIEFRIAQGPYGNPSRISLVIYGESTSAGVNAAGIVVGDNIFGTSLKNSFAVEETNIGLITGNILIRTLPDLTEEIHVINQVIESPLNTSFVVDDFSDFIIGEEIVGRAELQIEFDEDTWYVRNDGQDLQESALDQLGLNIDQRSRLSDEVRVIKEIKFPLRLNNEGLLDTVAERNFIAGVGTRSSVNSSRFTVDSSRVLRTDAEVNEINSVDVTNSVLTLTGRELSSIEPTVIGGIDNGSKLVQLDSAGRISASVFGQINLANTEVFTTSDERDDFTGRAWVSGDIAIIVGSDNIGICRDSSGDALDPQDGFTTRADCTAGPGNLWDTVTGTFAYQGAAQAVAGTTLDSDWVLIATPTGTVSSVSGKVGVVVLAQTDISGLENRLDNIETASSTNTDGVASNDDDIGILGSAGIQGVFEDSGIYTETAPGTGVYQDTNGNDFTGTIPDTFTTDPVDPVLSTGIRSNLEDLDTRVGNARGIVSSTGLYDTSLDSVPLSVHQRIEDNFNIKVDKVANHGLSQVDFTPTLKDKLDGVKAGAQINVQSDWTQTDTAADDYIGHKPDLPLAGTPADNWDNYITSAQVAPIQTYVAMKLENGTDLEIINYEDGDTIDIRVLQDDGYELIESNTGSTVRVDGTCSDTSITDPKRCDLAGETWTIDSTGTLTRISS